MRLLLELTDDERARFGQRDRFFAAVLDRGELLVTVEAVAEVMGPNGVAVRVPAIGVEVRGITTRYRSSTEARLYDDAPALGAGAKLLEGKKENDDG